MKWGNFTLIKSAKYLQLIFDTLTDNINFSYRPELPFVLPTDDLTSSRARLKRDLGLDPEDVLTVLSLWEAEHRVKADNNQR